MMVRKRAGLAMMNTPLPRFLHSAVAAIAVVLMAGCYTLLKHPPASTEEQQTNLAAVSHADDCVSCHESGAYLAAHGFGPPPPPAYDRWYYYYDYPWWIPYYAPRDTAGGATGIDQRPYGRRHRGADTEQQPPQVTTAETTPSPAPAIVAKSRDESQKEESKPSEKKEKRDERRKGTADAGDRRERKP